MYAQPAKVLLIDDDRDSHVITRSLLSGVEVPFELECVSSYEAGLRALCRGEHDACLLDYRLGARDGLELLRQAQAEGCRVPVIMLTGAGNRALDVQAMKAGAADYLVKNELTSSLLERSLRYAMERKRIEDWREQHEARLQLIAEHLPVALWTTDRQLRITSSLGPGLGRSTLWPSAANEQTLFEFFMTQDEDHPIIAAHKRAVQGASLSLDLDWLGRTFHAHLRPLQDRSRYGSEALAGVTGIALDITEHRRIEDEFRVAREIQQRLLPRSAPALAGFEIAGMCRPAESTGGDFFDYVPMCDGSLGIVVADVSSHGFAPALIMAGTRRLLRTLALESSDLRTVLRAANRAVVEDTSPEIFVTLFFARLDPTTSSLVYAGAGHDGYLFDAAGAVDKLPSAAMPLGVVEELDVACHECRRLQPGQMLAMFTDGFDEAMDPAGRLFGRRQVLQIIGSHRQRPAAEILQLLQGAVEDYCKPRKPHDDITAVIVKVTGS